MTNTIGVITRVCKSELPYLYSFVNHHINHGVNHVYLILQDTSIRDQINSTLNYFKGVFSVFLADPSLIPNTALERFDLKLTKTDYLLLLDIDEFFYSIHDVNLPESIKLLQEPDYMVLQWIMAPADFDILSRRNGFLGHTGKALAKRSAITKILTPHSFAVRSDIISSQSFKVYKGIDFHAPDTYLVHYWGRNFFDILLKCIYQQNMGIKTSSIDELKDAGKGGILPQRLKFLAVLNLHKRFINVPDFIDNQIDYDLEKSLIKSFLSDSELESIRGAYETYKSSLEYNKHVAIYPAFNTLLTLSKVLL